jgi:hypothetical protein
MRARMAKKELGEKARVPPKIGLPTSLSFLNIYFEHF